MQSERNLLPLNPLWSSLASTANKASDIPPPLLDRLEVITLSGYTMEEKGHIASAHLLPQLLKDHGLMPERLVFPADVVLHVIDRCADQGPALFQPIAPSLSLKGVWVIDVVAC